MADLSKIKVGSTTYNLKDTSARADISELNTEVSQQSATIVNKLDKNQGSVNVGKILEINAQGNLIPTEKPSGIGKNLLDNPWFNSGNVVNQRGVTNFTVGNYGIDRWKLISGSASVGTNGITLNGTLRQIRENSLGTNNLKASVICSSGTATASYNDSTKYFDIVSSGGVIKAAKLEVGSISTLEMDTAPNYAEELLKCQRFFYAFRSTDSSNFDIGIATCAVNNTLVYPTFNLPTQMRVAPSVTVSSNSMILLSLEAGVGAKETTAIDFNSANITNDRISLQLTSSGLTVRTWYRIVMKTNQYIYFSADL